MRARFPAFSLAREAENPEFRGLLRAGLPLERAYLAAHFDELLSDAVRAAADITEKRVADSVRAKGQRPAEAGLGRPTPPARGGEVARLTKRERAEIARRAMRGERIEFR